MLQFSNKIIDHSDVVEASPVGAAPNKQGFNGLDKNYSMKDETINILSCGIWCRLY